MKFCPKCGTRLRLKVQKPHPVLLCEKCGFSEAAEANLARSPAIEEEPAADLKILGEKEERIKTMPTTIVDCPKCGHNTAFWWFLQTRSGDEPPTQFFRCEKCAHTWRQYS